MDKHHNHHNNAGFMFGLIAGVALTLLLVTKKGRRILKVLTDEGMDKFGEWEDIIHDVKDALGEDDEMLDGDDYVEKQSFEHQRKESKKKEEPTIEKKESLWPGETVETPQKEVIKQHEASTVHQTTETPVETYTETPQPSTQTHVPVSRIRTTTRRFFRGVPRR
jgi:hypothetical protein